VQSFETALLTQDENFTGLAQINRELISKAEAVDSPQLSGGTGGAERARLGATGDTQEGKSRGNDSKGGTLVYAHTKPGDQNGNPSLHNCAAGLDSLTAREREVMGLVVSGLLNKQIAADWGASDITIKLHRAQVMQKMGAESLTKMVTMADKPGTHAPSNMPEQATIS